MFRRLTGSGFTVVLIALVAMKHTALGFCLCQEQVVTDPAGCCREAAAAVECCGEDGDPSEAPCRDCVVDLELDPGAFLWGADGFSPDEQTGQPVAVPAGMSSALPLAAPPARHVGTPRGSPPGLPPLWLRHSVLRL